jgi:hypothetical protein
MVRRPRPHYCQDLYKENPIKKDRSKLIKRYKNGGVKYEEDVQEKMNGVNYSYIYTDPLTQEKLKWLYVGEYWWCRYRSKSKKYEFARLYAIVTPARNKPIKCDGLWDNRRHGFKPLPEIVYRVIDNIKGFIIGYNEFEILVEWVYNGVRQQAVTVKDGSTIKFEFVEDYNKYKRILKYV